MTRERGRCTKVVHMNEEDKKKYTIRLNRIEGSVRGINRMISDDRHCDELLIQIAAVTKSLKSLGQELLHNHMKTCMVDDIKNNNYESIDEVMDLFRKLV